MDEIDYSAFLYKRTAKGKSDTPFKPTPPDIIPQEAEEVKAPVVSEKTEVPAQITPENSQAPFAYSMKGRKKQKPPKKKKGFLYIVFVFILCFAIVFFAADFFTSGKLIHSVAAGIGGRLYTYYAVVSDKATRELAYSQSLLIKQGGAGGYVIAGEPYKVVYAVFKTKQEAENVSAKNTNTYVQVLETRGKDKKFYDTIDGVIEALITASVKLEKGEMNEAEVFSTVKGQKAKSDAILSACKENTKEYNLASYVSGTLEALNAAVPEARLTFLSSVRYAICGIAVSTVS